MLDETKSDLSVEDLKSIPEMNLLTYYQVVDHLGQKIEDQFKIPKIVPIAQSAHESRNGNSGLARNHCNLFGIVATDSWKKKGKPVAAMKTWEHIKGKDITTTREFRKYLTWKESFYDWASLIVCLSVYKKAYELFKEGKIPEGIVEMGRVYATDPAYAKKLIEVYRMLQTD